MRGVTLIELLIVMMLLSLLVFAYPKFQKMIDGYRLDAYARTVLIDFQYALRMAQNSGKSVSLCISDDQIQCSETGNLHDWQRGWIIFYDVQHEFRPKSGQILRKTSMRNDLVVHKSDINIKNAIRLDGRRRFGRTAGTGLPNGSMTMCLQGQAKRILKVNIFGEARLDKLSHGISCE